jgi:hypothetical protein
MLIQIGVSMAKKQLALFMLAILLFSIPSYATAAKEAVMVEQFGMGFDETVIADSSDALSNPRDLEFHPGRANELWIANQYTDSITIVENTGLENQVSQNRQDSNRNHFLEEVSAIAFGAYHPEFDWQWGSAQETANTFCGQASPNNFMGPTLWPSSLSHFAVENQNNGNGLLGSHIDMNHESPYGVGIAHDSDNAYWYNDGYYEELVYYDFQDDHDTGRDDHSDAIVRRYSEVELTHIMGVPGHMTLDDDSGILYIADPGANRVLWVNTDDSSTSTQDIMSDSSRMEPLEEYSSITNIEWGVLASGLNMPSGIVLDDDQLFVSEYGNGQIVAYDLSSNGKAATETDSIQTSATSIMGLEIGPNGHLYYVDYGQDEVVRIDPYMDEDGDGVGDQVDNCPMIPNANQANHDGDLLGDACDDDDDGDGILDVNDECALGNLSWISSALTDHDTDGCADLTEDSDDDNDGIYDTSDLCPTGDLGWNSLAGTDYDGDGCRDQGEDLDDDNDRICDGDESSTWWVCSPSSAGTDLCPQSPPSFMSFIGNDVDRDGCEDLGEDIDDDNDGFSDDIDDCPNEAGTSSLGTSLGCSDYDGDGYGDTVDVFPVDGAQWSDGDGDGFGDNSDGEGGDQCLLVTGTSNQDRNGCIDTDGDGWSNPDGAWTVAEGADAFPDEFTQHSDQDGDGYGDASDGVQSDACPLNAGTSTEDRLGCIDSDGDGWSDVNDALPDDPTQHSDQDGDGFGDSETGTMPDSCPEISGTSDMERYGCPDPDGDGWAGFLDAFPDDERFWSDADGDGYPDQEGTNLSDDCPEVPGTSTEDRVGCVDGDGDGWSDDGDSYPKDASRFASADGSSSSNTLYLIVGFLCVMAVLVLGYAVQRRNREESAIKLQPNLPQPMMMTPVAPLVAPVVQAAAPAGPPLPAEGLPAGWTLDQWAWYGEDYLRNQ